MKAVLSFHHQITIEKHTVGLSQFVKGHLTAQDL